ncbi:MAG: hypothetical protein GY751_23245 [Bacteroidetes bacterium]|nr:hypothetical protein [Bacteroidota bacterium]
MKIIVLLVAITIVTITPACLSKQKPVNPPTEANLEVSEKLIQNLEETGFFKYTAPERIDVVKSYMLQDELLKYGLSFYHDDEDPEYYMSVDKRHHLLDGESLFEQGGITDQLNDLKSYFKAVELNIKIENHIETWTREEGLNHRLTINGKNYVLFENFQGMGWGEVAYKFGEILNGILKINKVEDRVYLISGGNDGSMVFLSPDQYEIIEGLYEDNEWKPREIEDWKRFMRVR